MEKLQHTAHTEQATSPFKMCACFISPVKAEQKVKLQQFKSVQRKLLAQYLSIEHSNNIHTNNIGIK